MDRLSDSCDRTFHTILLVIQFPASSDVQFPVQADQDLLEQVDMETLNDRRAQ